MTMSNNYKYLGEILVQKLRDENYQTYLEYKKHASSMTIGEYEDLSKNPDYDPELQKLDDERFYFLNSLDENQKKQLDKLILMTLDATAFNFLREIEEKMTGNNGIGLTLKETSIEKVYSEFFSGTFFGEYFLWIEKYSAYGKFQH